MLTLTTARLHLRSFRDDDLTAFAALCANEGFMRFSGSGPLDAEKAGALLERILSTRAGKPSQFAVFAGEPRQLIGYCGFFHQTVDGVEEIEIGYRLHPEFWNRGLATEAAQAVRDHAFRDLQLPRVISLIHPENHASERVALKNGMKLEKFTNFRGFPANVFAISRAEWEQLPKTETTLSSR
jgi:RimJ/RimL family protein N-acetyltransferase